MWLDKRDPHKSGFPTKYTPYMTQWKNMNQDWTIMYWNYSDIEREFPEYMPIIDKIPVWISKCDFARMLVIYKYGGVYIDLDFIPLRPFDDHVTNRDILLIYEPLEHSIYYGFDGLIMNGLLGCTPYHDFFGGYIELCIYKINVTDPTKWDVIKTIGPNNLYKYYYASWKDIISISYDETCLFIPTLQETIPDNGTTATCAPIKPYCTTKWTEGTEWFSNKTPNFELIRRNQYGSSRSTSSYILSILFMFLKVVLVSILIIFFFIMVIYLMAKYEGIDVKWKINREV